MLLLVSMVLWLSANFWWMAGETRIAGDDDVNSQETSYIMESALALLVLFYAVVKPMGLIPENAEVNDQFEVAGACVCVVWMFRLLLVYISMSASACFYVYILTLISLFLLEPQF